MSETNPSNISPTIDHDIINEAIRELETFLEKKGLSENFEVSQLRFSEKKKQSIAFALQNAHNYRYETICRRRLINGQWIEVCDYGYVRD
jgi:hypothetical protein